jgi:HlyD family secretion protein
MYRTVAAILTLSAGWMSGQEPIVHRSEIWVDTVKRGDIARMVRGLGVLAAQRTVELKIPQPQAQEVKAGQKAVIDTGRGRVGGTVGRVDPSVTAGIVRIEVQLESDPPPGVGSGANVDGTIHLLTLKDAVYVGRPATGLSERAGTIFRLDADGQHAVRVQVEFGLTALRTVGTRDGSRPDDKVVEIRAGLQPGDKVLLSDMSAFRDKERVRLQ